MKQGFALPSVMIASVVMLIVMSFAMGSVSTTRATLSDQHYTQLAKEAIESGIAKAEACMRAGPTWWSSNPLRPSGACAGSSTQCEQAGCYVLSLPNLRTTFRIDPSTTVISDGKPVEFTVVATVELLRTSTGAPWRKYEQVERWQTKPNNLVTATGAYPVGTSISGYWSSPPEGYLLEDGTAVSRTLYADLFAVIGTTYGSGDGSTTFNLPDSRGRVSVNLNTSDTEFNALGKKFGTKTHTLTIAEMPNHTHDQRVTANSGGTALRRDWSSDGPGGIYAQGVDTGLAGGSQAHSNIQPSIVKMSAIKYAQPAEGMDIMPGQSIEGYWSTPPAGYLREDGAAVSRTTYATLFSVIGTAHGTGNGSTTFNVPDSRGRVKVNMSPSDAEFDTMGEKFGTKTHTLTIAEMPNHTHDQRVTAPNAAGTAIRRDWASDGPGGIYAQGITTNSTGGGQAHNNIQPSITKLSVIKHAAMTAGSNDGVPRGTSVASYQATPPAGYLPEDGAAVSRTAYAELFALIGAAYGAGDGSTTFNLPDSRGRAGVNLSPSDAEFDTMGEKFGAKAHTLSIAEMPSHSHTQRVTANSGGTALRRDWSSDGAGGVYAQGITTGSAGGGQAHNNIQPSIALRYYIKQ